MNKSQINKLKMYEVTLQKLQENTDATVLDKMPNFEGHLTMLASAVDGIKSNGAIQALQIEGSYDGKMALRIVASELGVKISTAVKAYAMSIGDLAVVKKADYTLAKLTRYGDNIVLLHFNDIVSLGNTYLSKLADYHVDASVMANFSTAIAAFENYIPNPRKEIVTRKGATARLTEYFALADEQLVFMDVLTKVIADQEPAFFTTYTNSRIIVNTGKRTLSLRGLVTDVSGMPMAKVAIRLKGTAYSFKTSDKGAFRVFHLPEGTYEMVLQKMGYRDLSVTVHITNTERTEVRLEMELA